ncbi:MAG: branched-chain amino acid ABC transporter permease [Clostridia bacterium]|nr:branched-chain amino acid ABC transporter permease [Clostridia bacterium]
MDFFFGLVFNAILLGCTYTLVAIGFSLFFGVMNVVVFCCGDIAVFGAFSMMGAYAVVYSAGLFDVLPFTVCVLLLLLIGALFCTALGLCAYQFSIKPFEKASDLMPLLSTIALGTVVKEVLGLFFQPIVNAASTKSATETAITVVSGRNPQAFPTLIAPGGSIDLRNVIVIVVTVFLLLALYLFLNKTKTGLAMQAVSQNKELAFIVGINVYKITVLTFVVGSIMLAIGGFLIGNYQTIMSFDDGAMYGVKGFAAAVVGGLRNTFGSVIGGMLLAFVEVFVSGYIPGGTAYASICAFIIVVLFIIFKPEGIIGDKSIEKV